MSGAIHLFPVYVFREFRGTTCYYSEIVALKIQNTRLDCQEIVLRFPTGARGFSLFESVQSGFWCRSSSYSMGTSGSFVDGAEAGGAMNLTTHLNLVLRLRIHGAIPPNPHIASRCGA
jgi:hypothetical protein